jgi:hypothetical protein
MSRAEELTALDWIGAGLALMTAAFPTALPLTVGPAFQGMFQDFGTAELPTLTQLVLSSWFPPLLGLVPLVLLASVVVARPMLTTRARRGLIVGAFFAGFGASALCLYALYLPVFSLAGQIR